MVIAGPWVCIFGAIYIDKIIVEPLTNFVSLIPKSRDDDHVRQIARFLEALKLAMNRLAIFYQNLVLDEQPNDQRYFPYTQTYRDENDLPINFTYLHPLTDDFQKPIWKAMTSNGKSIVVKFTQQYNMTAHNICANQGLAPKLLYCGNVRNGFIMIVMGYVDGYPLTQNQITCMDNGARTNVYKDVQRAITALHNQDIVFADLRRPNILVVEALRGMLVDFDWCGAHNIDIYPITMSTEISWPDGAKPGALLMREHDRHWLHVLKQDLNII